MKKNNSLFPLLSVRESGLTLSARILRIGTFFALLGVGRFDRSDWGSSPIPLAIRSQWAENARPKRACGYTR